VLVGFMATGKTTVGRSLAQKLQWSFRDLDAWIEERHKLSVREIFSLKGEGVFRDEERRLAEEARTLERHVIAVGGGAFAQEGTRAALQEGALTIWLQCSLDVILSRIGADPSRPLATGRERMQQLLAEREVFYRLADKAVDTTETPADEVANRIMRALFPGGAPPGGTDR
jgi:shikimate kinase